MTTPVWHMVGMKVKTKIAASQSMKKWQELLSKMHKTNEVKLNKSTMKRKKDFGLSSCVATV